MLLKNYKKSLQVIVNHKLKRKLNVKMLLNHPNIIFNLNINQSEKYKLLLFFLAFVVKHEITIKIKKLDGIGKMTDQLLQAGGSLITIDSFQWKSQNQQNPQKQALKAGLEDGKQICQRMGLKLSKILSVQQVDQADQQPAQDQEEQQQGGQEQEEQEPAEIVVFKFEVECN